MGLIKSTINSIGSALVDQFKEYIVCPKMSKL